MTANNCDIVRRPVAVDLFAGAGGMSLGLEQAGFDVLLAVDRDGHHVAVHDRNFPYGTTLCSPIQQITSGVIKDHIGNTEVDLICGGPPCQGFSSMGIRDNSDPRNALVDEFVRIICEVAPKSFLMENVPGMNSGDTAAILDRALHRLQTAGYRITRPVRSLNALDFGVPQNRVRLFVLGLRQDVAGEIAYPAGPDERQPPRPNIREALGGLPEIDHIEELYSTDLCSYDDSVPPSLHPYAQALLGYKEDMSDYSRPRKWDSSVCSGCSRVKHSLASITLYDATKPGTMVPGHKLPRLEGDGIAPTLRAGSESEHGSYTAPRPIHFSSPRCITPREAARLHGYPDWFRFYPGKSHAARQIGNSVCPPIARALGAQIMSALGFKPERISQVIVLSEEFRLPVNRPRQQRRITQTSEWPKILEWLFDQASDSSGRVHRPDFSVEDVETAYKATNANMPRNPSHRFLADIARSRNREKIMAAVIAKGYSIQAVEDRHVYGRFVPAGFLSTLEKKTYLSVSSQEINASLPISGIAEARLDDDSLVLFATSSEVTKVLFREGRLEVNIQRDLLGDVLGSRHRCTLSFSDGRSAMNGIIVASRLSSVPNLPELETLLTRIGCELVIVLAPLTEKHFAGIVLRSDEDNLIEMSRAVFYRSSRDGRVTQSLELLSN